MPARPRLGVAVLEEAFELRRPGIDAPIPARLAAPGAPCAEALGLDIELAAYSCSQLDAIARAAQLIGGVARVHLKVETGMWRGGAAGEWPDMVAPARRYEEEGVLHVQGVWSHLACADTPDNPANDAQLAVFLDAVATAHAAGLRPTFRHPANSAAALTRADMHFDIVRCGLAVYGVNPLTDQDVNVDLRPAMAIKAHVAHVKTAPAGVGVSYSLTYVTTAPTTLAVVPLGYADGVPVLADPGAPIGRPGTALQIAGRVCMDQLIVDMGEVPVEPGDVVTLLGPGDDGEHTAAQWASASGRSAYDILTGFARRRVPIFARQQ
ncbi:alanine racemase [Nocardioides sp. B-3]|uniref:alanine racemase n=1 Tax=Nocardioides sp. B-3 TaxID=2895565 RepID=UPI003FA562F2